MIIITLDRADRIVRVAYYQIGRAGQLAIYELFLLVFISYLVYYLRKGIARTDFKRGAD